MFRAGLRGSLAALSLGLILSGCLKSSVEIKELDGQSTDGLSYGGSVYLFARTSSAAGVDCSSADATIEYSVYNADLNTKVCQEFQPGPSIGGTAYLCDRDDKFNVLSSPWIFDPSIRAWHFKANLNNPNNYYLPGTYSLAVMSNSRQVSRSNKVTVSRPGKSDCYSGSSPAPTGTPTVTPTLPPPANADPGFGLWSPNLNAKPVVYVVDQSTDQGQPVTITSVPGCVNGLSVDNSSSCRASNVYIGTINGQSVSVDFSLGKIISIRYKSNSTPLEANSGFLRLNNDIGGSIFGATRVSLTTVPGDMAPTNPRCVTKNTGGVPTIIVGKDWCPVLPNTQYYLNIEPLVHAERSTVLITENVRVFDR